MGHTGKQNSRTDLTAQNVEKPFLIARLKQTILATNATGNTLSSVEQSLNRSSLSGNLTLQLDFLQCLLVQVSISGGLKSIRLGNKFELSSFSFANIQALGRFQGLSKREAEIPGPAF